ncbi:MAG: proteasome subunit beta [Acidobacteria bacterium]|nr:MAG: proteasome subunit beta [Acidobacteriota bacterium]
MLRRERPDLVGNECESHGLEIAEGTTVLSLRYDLGVVIAGDRRATEGSFIAHRSIEKVFLADDFSGVAIAGAAGPALEMVRLFQTELEHYEKVQGDRLSLEGKANRLATLIRNNFALAVQGLVVVPIFAGFDLRRGVGRIFKYDVTGGRYEESDYHAEGSGGRIARSYIKQHFEEGLSEEDAVRVATGALYEAADEDSGTGGPDLARGIYPTVASIDSGGFRAIPENVVAERFGEVLGAERGGHRPRSSSRKRQPSKAPSGKGTGASKKGRGKSDAHPDGEGGDEK